VGEVVRAAKAIALGFTLGTLMALVARGRSLRT
jgi:hypothetical protein